MVLGSGMIGSRAARRSGLLLYAAANCQRGINSGKLLQIPAKGIEPFG